MVSDVEFESTLNIIPIKESFSRSFISSNSFSLVRTKLSSGAAGVPLVITQMSELCYLSFHLFSFF